jgi:Macrocin-O-methyltransferase (TylF)
MMGTKGASARLKRLIRDPRRWLPAVKRRAIDPFETLPYRFGITSTWPRSFMAYIPDRYSVNAQKTVQRTGSYLFKDTSGFLRGQRMNNAGDLTRFYLFNLILEQIQKEGLDGNLAELGVYKGNTAVLLASFARTQQRTVYLFDTFEGFPKADIHGIDALRPTLFEDTSIERVKSLVGVEGTEYVVGYFPESTAAISSNLSFCLVHVDCDLYAPMKSALEYFYPRLVPGGFFVLHDYSSLHWDGVEKAIDEFWDGKLETVVPIPDKSGTVVVRKVK